ncbi:MAG: pseudouridine synthase [Saccharofermentans sp.]|nr:pseudouridine synthase [Saccharofermentans sp.]
MVEEKSLRRIFVDMILYKDEYIAIYIKEPGEDSEKLNLPEELCGYKTISRLDKPVGGLLALAAPNSSSKLKDVEFHKEYIAVVSGTMETAQGSMLDFLYHDKRNNKTFPVKRMRNGVKEASLEYQVLGVNERHNLSLVKIVLGTGRTHQIRVQFASRKHPLYGDGKYGSRFKGLPALCCRRIEFIHPIKNSPMVFEITPEGEPWNLFI